MNCETARRLIDPYMDSELDSTKAIDVEKHLSGCQACRNSLELRQELSRAIKLAAIYAPAPERLRLHLRRKARISPRFRFGLVSTALAFAVGVAAVLGIWQPWASKERERDRMLSDMVTQHRRSVDGQDVVEVASKDPKAVQSWLYGRIDYSPKVPQPSEKGFKLIGGRLDIVGGHTVPVLAYTSGTHKIDVFVTPSWEVNLTDADRAGMHVMSWEDCGLNYWVVSDDPVSDLLVLRQAFWGPRRDH